MRCNYSTNLKQKPYMHVYGPIVTLRFGACVLNNSKIVFHVWWFRGLFTTFVIDGYMKVVKRIYIEIQTLKPWKYTAWVWSLIKMANNLILILDTDFINQIEFSCFLVNIFSSIYNMPWYFLFWGAIFFIFWYKFSNEFGNICKSLMLIYGLKIEILIKS